jgi:hypothetical protein
MHPSVRWEAIIRIENLVRADDGIGVGVAKQNRSGHVFRSGSDRLLDAFAEALFCMLGRSVHSALGDRPELQRGAGSSACQCSCLKSTRSAREHGCFSSPAQHAVQVPVMQPMACALHDMIAHLPFSHRTWEMQVCSQKQCMWLF